MYYMLKITVKKLQFIKFLSNFFGKGKEDINAPLSRQFCFGTKNPTHSLTLDRP